MPLALNDRVQQTGTANTTVSFTLSGSVAGFQSFAVVGNGNTTYYGSFDGSGNWEVGVGTYSTTGPTLTRTTILSSSNSNTAVTFSGAINIFVTYPSSKSIYEDELGNVSPLGTIASGVWQGSTVGVAYGGTGVTTSSGANSVMLRDANQNVAINRLNQSNTATTAAAGTTILTAASTYSQTLNGSTTQTYRMPDATTLTTGVAFEFNNNSSGLLTIQDSALATITTITSGGAIELVLLSNGTVAGTWDVHGYLPENVTWGTNALALGSTVISGGTWQGGTINTGYGGTNLTTFGAANNALYSTSASALTAGTLPVAAGGTGATTLTLNGVVFGNGTSAAGITAAGTTGQVLVATTSGAPSWGAIPTTAAVTSITFGTTGLTPNSATTGAVTVAGTLIGANGGTGQSTYAVGDLLQGGATNTLTKLAAVATGNALISGGLTTASSWGKIGLTTHVTGTLPIANGGTNGTATPTLGGVIVGTGTAYASTAAGTTGQVLLAQTGAAPIWGSAGVTSIAGTANQITASASTGAVTLSTPSTFIAPGSIAATTTVTGTILNATSGFILNGLTISASYTIPASTGAHSVGTITINSGVIVTVSSGSRWVIL